MNRRITLAIIIIFSLVVFSAPLWADSRWVVWFQDRQGFYQTATVLVLIIITVYYAIQTQIMADAMEQQRLDAVQPELVFCETYVNPIEGVYETKQVLPLPDGIDLRQWIRVQNFGVGLARDIVSRIVVNGASSPGMALPPLAPGYWTGFDLSPHSAWLEEIRQKEKGGTPPVIYIELRCHDTFGKPHITTLQLKHDDHKGGYNYNVEGAKYTHRPIRGIQSQSKPDGSGRITPPDSSGI